jgi:hypothetical protein
MKSWGHRHTIHQFVLDHILRAKSGTLPAPELPDSLVNWLAQLTLLYGVPVEYMVPDIRMLPVESMRFFFLDRNWLDRLVDGAISVGAFSSKEQIFNEAFYEDIYAQVDARQVQLRSVLRKESPTAVATTGGVITGLLFRSRVVSGWPGLEVDARNNNVPLTILRMDRLSDNLLLCLFEGQPDQVSFIEPGEGLHFGIKPDTSNNNTFTISLRGLGFPDVKTYPPGKQIKGKDGKYLTASGSLLTGPGQEPGVVDINGLKNNIIANMPAGSLENGQLTPAGMAIQLVQGAGNQLYDLNSPACIYQN